MKKEKLGRVLGPARGEGNEMAKLILKNNIKVVPCRSLRPLQLEEIHSATEQRKSKVFGILIKGIWGTLVNPAPTSSNAKIENYLRDTTMTMRRFN